MGLRIKKKMNRAAIAEALSFERRQFAILFLWEGYGLTGDECAKTLVLMAITHLAEQAS